MRTFVMGDLHGAAKALAQCMKLVRFDYDADTLIQLGDVVDDFPDSYEAVEHLLRVKNLIAIKGNHDDWFLEFIKTGIHPAEWQLGSRTTAESYLKQTGQAWLTRKSGLGYDTGLRPGDVPESHQEFFRNQRLYFIDDQNNCFVHAGFDRRRPFFGQELDQYIWDRDLWTQALNWLARKIVHHEDSHFEMVTHFNHIFIGHTPTLNWKLDKPMKAANIYNMDTGAGHFGRLTIMDVETKKYWQSDLVESLYERRAEQYSC